MPPRPKKKRKKKGFYQDSNLLITSPAPLTTMSPTKCLTVASSGLHCGVVFGVNLVSVFFVFLLGLKQSILSFNGHLGSMITN